MFTSANKQNLNEIRICPWTSVWSILWCFNYLKLDKSIKLMWSVNYCLRINRYWRAYSVEYMKNEKHSVLVEKAVSISETPLGLMNCLTSIWNEEFSLKKVKCKIVASLVTYYLACVFYSFSQNLPFITVLITLMGVIRITKCQPGESETLVIILFQCHLCQFMLSCYLKCRCQSCDSIPGVMWPLLQVSNASVFLLGISFLIRNYSP